MNVTDVRNVRDVGDLSVELAREADVLIAEHFPIILAQDVDKPNLSLLEMVNVTNAKDFPGRNPIDIMNTKRKRNENRKRNWKKAI